MNKKLKVVFMLIFIVSATGLAWVATGNHVESGYLSCGGGGFISQRELDASVGPNGINPGGPCLGEPVTKLVGGRYIYTYALTGGLALIAFVSVVGYSVIVIKSHKAKTAQSRKT